MPAKKKKTTRRRELTIEDWRHSYSNEHYPTDSHKRYTSQWQLPVGKRGLVSIYRVSLTINPNMRGGELLTFHFVSDFGPNSERSYSGAVFAVGIHQAKMKILKIINDQNSTP